ncbi:MAG: hypothetical protein ACR2N5_06530 [Solirubrobacterales bacterium]
MADGPAPWLDVVSERGGRLIADAASASSSVVDGGSLLVIPLRDNGLLPPIARLTPVQATALLLLGGEPARASRADVLLRSLEGAGAMIYAIKQGLVGGPADRRGATEVSADLVATVLDAEAGGEVEWERDPDFGYEVAAPVPGLSNDESLAMMPRLLYARHGRVYEHASLVAEAKRRRRQAFAATDGLDEAIAGALD